MPQMIMLVKETIDSKLLIDVNFLDNERVEIDAILAMAVKDFGSILRIS